MDYTHLDFFEFEASEQNHGLIGSCLENLRVHRNIIRKSESGQLIFDKCKTYRSIILAAVVLVVVFDGIEDQSEFQGNRKSIVLHLNYIFFKLMFIIIRS